MTKTGIIGHRGAAGLALENSLDSIMAALDLPIDAIEFDVRLTRDGHLVVLHDAHTGRIADRRALVRDLTLTELQNLQLKNGQKIPTLDGVLALVGGKKPVVIDIKDSGSSKELLRSLAKYSEVSASFTSLLAGELAALHSKGAICVRDRWNLFRVFGTARRLSAEAISLNMRVVNPITYQIARKRGLEVRIYTVNNPRLVRFFRRLYPGIIIYTDNPERLYDRDP